MSSATGKELAKYLEPLTEKQRLYVAARLKGMSKVASATAAGITNPAANANKFESSAAVREAIRRGTELLATEILFDRRTAHEMYMDAHRNAATATEQIMAITAMVKLHGVAAPEVKELRHQVTGKVEHEQVKKLSDADLLRLAKLPDDRVPEVLDGEYEIVDERRDEQPAAQAQDAR